MAVEPKRVLMCVAVAVLATSLVDWMLGSNWTRAEIQRMRDHGTLFGLYVAVVFLAILAAWWATRPGPQEPLVDKGMTHQIANEVLEDAMKAANAEVEVPAEVERRFRTSYWIRLSRLFKL